MRKEPTIRKRLQKLKEQVARDTAKRGQLVWFDKRPKKIAVLEWVLCEDTKKEKAA